MTTWLYDGSFDGFLSAVFDLYWQRRSDVRICKELAYVPALFGPAIFMPTVTANAERVWAGLRKRLSATGLEQLFACYLAEIPREEDNMVGFIRHVFAGSENVETDFGNPYVLRIAQLSRMVHREKHRMEAFVRFQQTTDGIYYAVIEPDYNVLPLITSHFKDRYADQDWLIYDLRRHYGIYYNYRKEVVDTVNLQFKSAYVGGRDVSPVWSPDETLYQRLWQTYFREANIPARSNRRLHLQHVPRRYWKYLTEKQPPR